MYFFLQIFNTKRRTQVAIFPMGGVCMQKIVIAFFHWSGFVK